jgi:hypothetical protein
LPFGKIFMDNAFGKLILSGINAFITASSSDFLKSLNSTRIDTSGASEGKLWVLTI